jgi:signal transduction histidine kinase
MALRSISGGLDHRPQERAQLGLVPVPVFRTDVGKAAEDAASHRRSLQGMRVEIWYESDLGEGGVVANVDPAWLTPTIEELLDAAAQRSPFGGGIYIRAERALDGPLLVIEDDGPTVCAGADVPVDVEGGFAFLEMLAAIHGASLWVEPRPKGGASFRILFRG